MGEAIRLEQIDLAALEIMAKYRQVSPERLLHDLVRDAALTVILGRPADTKTAQQGQGRGDDGRD